MQVIPGASKRVLLGRTHRGSYGNVLERCSPDSGVAGASVTFRTLSYIRCAPDCAAFFYSFSPWWCSGGHLSHRRRSIPNDSGPAVLASRPHERLHLAAYHGSTTRICGQTRSFSRERRRSIAGGRLYCSAPFRSNRRCLRDRRPHQGRGGCGSQDFCERRSVAHGRAVREATAALIEAGPMSTFMSTAVGRLALLRSVWQPF